MYNFFVGKDNKKGERYFISGDDYNHIKNVLRMSEGDTFFVSCDGVSDLCKIAAFADGTVIADIEKQNYQNTNLPVKIHLFQGLPKSDKFEFIVQKAVELGCYGITPVEMKRSVVKLDEKKKKSRLERWQAISAAAAKQSKRSFIPQIGEVLTYKQMLLKAADMDIFLVPYECADGMESTKRALSQIKSGMNVGILIGPEGGFETAEIEAAKESGGKIISLGSRILRCETAAVTAAAMCMLYSEMNLK